MLSNGYETIVDDDDYDRLAHEKWHGAKGRSGIYVCTGGKPSIRMHRMIMGAKPGMFVDHVNGNPLDNRKENLRVCSNAENIRNSRKYSTNQSGYKGVSFVERKKKWAAKITFNYKKYFLGYFKTKEEAFEAYKSKAKEFFGEFARFE